MIQTVLKIDGMACSMCEAHVNDAIRAAVKAKKVTASHKKGEAVVLSDTAPDVQTLRAAVEKTGYRVLDVAQEPYEKTGLFGRRKP